MKIFLSERQAVLRRNLPYYPAIDFFRWLGALVILIWHYHHFYFEKPYFGPTNGSPSWVFEAQPFYEYLALPYHHGMWAVQFFWMLSGFVFGFVYLGRGLSAKEFFILRFSRLYPLHFLSLILIASLQYFSLLTLGSFQILEINDLYHFALNLFYAQHWGFEEGYSFNSPSWSVSVEELVYWGFWLLVIRFNARSFSLILLIAGLAFLMYPVLGIFAFAFFFFFGGVLVYQLHTRLSSAGVGLVAAILFALVVVTIQVISISPLLAEKFAFPFLVKIVSGWQNLCVFLSFAVILLIVAEVDARTFLPNGVNQFFKKAGSLTYSTYMLHLPIQVLIIIICDHLSISRAVFDGELVFIIYLVLVIAVGAASYFYFERPMQALIRKRFIG